MIEETPLADPYPAYARLREVGGAHHVRFRSGLYGWVITRYDDARAALADPRLSKDPRHAPPDWQAAGRGRPLEDRSGLGAHLLTMDPPEHTRVRRLMSGFFTPRRLEAMRPRVRATAHALIDARPACLITGFAAPLQLAALCDLLGIPPADRGAFGRWTDAVVSSQGDAAARPEALGRLTAYVTDLIAAKRRAPADDVVSALTGAAGEQGRLTGAELLPAVFLLLVAGYETTVGLIGLAVHALLRHPAPGLGDLDVALEELLRYDSPVELSTWRFAVEPVEIGGTRLEAGQPVLVAIAAANRDPARFPDPDVPDLGRADTAHLSFGHGPHYCLGAGLARVVGREALGALTRLRGLALAVPPDALRWRASLTLRGPLELPVTYDRVAPARA